MFLKCCTGCEPHPARPAVSAIESSAASRVTLLELVLDAQPFAGLRVDREDVRLGAGVPELDSVAARRDLDLLQRRAHPAVPAVDENLSPGCDREAHDSELRLGGLRK